MRTFQSLVSGSVMTLLLAAASHAAPNLVVNGGFEQTALTASGQFNQTGVTGWTTGGSDYGRGYNFVYFPGTADSTGAYTPEFNGNIVLWGPNAGSANGLPAQSPAGGNFVGADAAFQVSAISQTISNLIIGEQYAVSFYWAGAQQAGYFTPTTEQWRVFLGSQEQDTPVVVNAAEGFTGWMKQTFVFRPAATTQTLSFLAQGTPEGQPPFALLDGVSLVDVDEPGTLALVGGVLAVFGGRRWLFRRTCDAV